MRDDLHRTIIAAVPMLRPLTPEELDEVLAISKLLRVAKDVTLIREGEVGHAFYIVVSGRLKVVKEVGPDETKSLAVLQAGEVVGEMALLDRSPRSASVITLAETVVYQIDLKAFRRLRAAFRPAAFKILRQLAPVLCRRIRAIGQLTGDILGQGTGADDEETRRSLAARIQGR